jgi:peptidoglycan-N-acetylglucosamine deacetylase
MPPSRSTWQPAPSIWASIALHGVAGLGCALQPNAWPIALGAVVANHAGLTVAGLVPCSRLLGPNILRLNDTATAERKIALTFDDGPNPDLTPWVLDQLDTSGAKATFFCVGEDIKKHAALAREIVARGHSIENHSNLHALSFSFFGMRSLRKDIATAQQTIFDETGVYPTLFRAPAGLRSPLLDPVLANMGLRLVSWTRRGFDTFDPSAKRVLARLNQNLAAGDILLLHDGNPKKSRQSQGQPTLYSVLPQFLKQLREQNLASVTITANLIS